jgi:transposase-like protein
VSHANARLTVHGRALLIERVVGDRRPVAHVARELGISRQCAHRWVRRFRDEGAAGLIDRSSRPRRTPTRTSPTQEQAVLKARARIGFGPARLSAMTGVPARTISRILVRHQIPGACGDARPEHSHPFENGLRARRNPRPAGGEPECGGCCCLAV